MDIQHDKQKIASSPDEYHINKIKLLSKENEKLKTENEMLRNFIKTPNNRLFKSMSALNSAFETIDYWSQLNQLKHKCNKQYDH